MYKVLLVDDEVWIKRSLRKEIDWPSFEIGDVAEASDGEEAYRLATEYKPDVIITDVKMPRMDGIELARIVSRSMPEVKVIILSGYAEFGLVRQALNERVIDYILKPINRQDLVTAIRRSVDEIGKERKRREQDFRLKTLLDRSLPLWTEKCIYDLLHKELDEDKGAELARMTELPLTEEPHAVLLIKGSGTLSAEAISAAYTRARDGSRTPHLILPHFQTEREYLLIAPFQGGSAAAYAELSCRIAAIRQFLSDTGEQVHIGAGSIRAGWHELGASYREAVYACRQAALEPDGGVVLYAVRFGRKETSEVIEQIKTYLESAYREPLTLEGVAQRFYLNPSYLSRLFKQVTGENFIGYITRIRIEEAYRLLMHTEMPVHQVGEHVGYENTNYFSKSFKKVKGFAPAECKKLFR
ncbi:response regulator [Paenibacillus sp. MMO-177]|uniref:response regulator n=1 Tax=Paenibacillus sp. MMO-177 TaxID=3081289 RepID=UPI00301B2658